MDEIMDKSHTEVLVILFPGKHRSLEHALYELRVARFSSTCSVKRAPVMCCEI